MRPTLTAPVPILFVGCAGALGDEPGNRSPSEKLPEQPASRMADPRRTSDRKTGGSESREACNTRNIRAGLLDGAHDVTVNPSLQQAFIDN
jgi:hypothetical protein